MGGIRNQKETSTGDDPKKDSGWEDVVVANKEIGRIEIIHPGQVGRSQSTESWTLVHN